MGFWSNILGQGRVERLKNSITEAVSKSATNKKEDGLKDFKDLSYRRINETIENARFAYKFDPTISSTIDNAILIANSEFDFEADDPQFADAAVALKDVADERWDLHNVFEEVLKKAIRDGSVFVQQSLRDGEVHINFLAFDGDTFDFKVIRDPSTEQIVGYKQKVNISQLDSGWETKNFDDVEEGDATIGYFNFAPEEIINPLYKEEDGEGNSAIFSCIDDVDRKFKIKQYMMNAAHKAGKIISLQIGEKDVDISKVTDATIDDVLEWFTEQSGKEVVAHPLGITPTLLGDSQIVDFIIYFNFLKSEIRDALLTPDSKFDSTGANRATANEQLSGATGYIVYIESLQNFLKHYFKQLFNSYLLNEGYEAAIGHVDIKFPSLRPEDPQIQAAIGQQLGAMNPDVDMETLVETYFPKYSKALQKKGVKLENTKEDKAKVKNMIEQDLMNRGFVGIKAGA